MPILKNSKPRHLPVKPWASFLPLQILRFAGDIAQALDLESQLLYYSTDFRF